MGGVEEGFGGVGGNESGGGGGFAGDFVHPCGDALFGGGSSVEDFFEGGFLVLDEGLACGADFEVLFEVVEEVLGQVFTVEEAFHQYGGDLALDVEEGHIGIKSPCL